MKCYTFSGGSLSEGIAVVEDERLGMVVFLGEQGRGRRYEKVGLFCKNPAEVKDGKVHEAHPVKITVNRNTEKERSFFVLAKPNNGKDQRVLVLEIGVRALPPQPRDFFIEETPSLWPNQAKNKGSPKSPKTFNPYGFRTKYTNK
jgi:hypothetical protein